MLALVSRRGRGALLARTEMLAYSCFVRSRQLAAASQEIVNASVIVHDSVP
jgi:hypothetical protein